MLNSREITGLLRKALKETLADSPEQADAHEDTSPLSGAGGLLDSYNMMLFLVEVDHLLSEATGRDIVLVDDSALARRDRPFATLRAMAAYIEEYLKAMP